MGKHLYITEKPSVAASFATVLGVKMERADRGRGYAESDSAVVTWCFGHLVTMAFPDAYNPEYKSWNVRHLPIIPEAYQYTVIDEPGARRQFETVQRLLNRGDVDLIYACTDSGREGEYIFRLVYAQSGCTKPARRVWISAQTEEAVRRGIDEARDISQYDSLSRSAYCRAREDWLFGMNFSRLYTCQYGRDLSAHLGEQKSAVIAIGRVMTCVLGLVVDRELEIRHFVPKVSFGVVASFLSGDSQVAYKGRWQPPKKKKAENGVEEEEDRGMTREEADALIESLRGKAAAVKKVDIRPKPEPPPLLFNLAELQSEANKKFKMPVDRVLEVAQQLYEKKLISYPRTDSRVLSTEVVPELPKVLNGLFGNPAYKELVVAIKGFGKLAVDKGSKRFVDDSKVTDHYAIIPTYVTTDPDKLDPDARAVYNLIVRRFLAIFYPSAEFTTVRVETAVGQETFVTSSRTLKAPGWKAVYEVTAPKGEDDTQTAPLHLLVKKEPCAVTAMDTEEKQTKPPARFTDGSLILTMEKAGKFIEDEELREQIKTCGIGTSATRAAIIKKLRDIRYISIHPKNQTVTPTLRGEAIVSLVRLSAKELLSPSLTASWEKGLLMIQNNETTEQVFMEKLTGYIGRTIQKVMRHGDAGRKLGPPVTAESAQSS